MKTKPFDCVEMKHKGGDRIYEATKGMTLAERLAYWQKRNQEARELQATARTQRKAG